MVDKQFEDCGSREQKIFSIGFVVFVLRVKTKKPVFFRRHVQLCQAIQRHDRKKALVTEGQVLGMQILFSKKT